MTANPELPEIYVSTDIEADGPIPGPHSMLSFGSAAYLEDRTLVGTYTANIDTLPGASGHPSTMRWWKKQKAAWKACRENPRPPEIVMPEYVAWVKALPGRPVFVGYPAVFDFMFIYWYLIRFAGESPFSFVALDIKTYAMAMLDSRFDDTVKRNMPRRWFVENAHSHVALADAIEQGLMFCNMLEENRSLREGKAPPDRTCG